AYRAPRSFVARRGRSIARARSHVTRYLVVTTAALVLAAGGSSRFQGEQSKLVSIFRGRPLVEWAVDAAVAAGMDETVVVTGPVDLAHLLPNTVTILHNESWEEGQATSLRVGLHWCGQRSHDAVVVGLADQPMLRSEAWQDVARTRAHPITVATYAGQRGNPVRLARQVWPLLDVGGDEGARSLMRRRPELVGEVACVGDPGDVDTVEDLKRWS
ncbi:MAG: nucleotidyltransferase family protein, partial [Mycobacterium sp.]